MPNTTIILKSDAGIKRDGTKFDGNFYTDGQWVRWQRGLPRKMAGYRSTQRQLSEISRGFSTFTQSSSVYCHTGGESTFQRFTLDSVGNSSTLTTRTPVGAGASGTVTLESGASGSVDSIKVNDVEVLSGAVAFNTDLVQTAADVASDINSYSLTSGYSATSDQEVVTITNDTDGSFANGYAVVVVSTTITTSKTDMANGSDALVININNQWMMDYQYDSSSNQNYILAHVAPNLSCTCNASGGQIFFGDVTGSSRLISVNLPPDANCTGGLVSLHPYLFYYGTDGIIGWSKPGEPTNLTDLENGAGIARVWGQKIIKGMPLRAGSGSAPAGLFWAYDAVIRAIFTGGDTVFQFDVVATDTSIISPNSVIDYDGVFFWCGVDRFLMFNGVVREVPNSMNLNYFFDGINKSASTKVFAFKVPRYGEIWWCYPRGSATECTHAVVYNVRENTWYDTELPNNGRSAGQFNNSFAAPLLTGVNGIGNDYKVWLHEQGVDEIDNSIINPIRSYFETADLSSLVQGRNEYVRITRIEPDFIQVGDMSVQVTGRANARAQEVYSSAFTFPATASTPQEQIVMMKEQRRELRVRFESNAIYGDYQMGQIIGHISTGDRTVLG